MWPLIGGLALAVGGDYLFGSTGITIGANLLYCLSVFYFFQGFGIMSALLDHIKLKGFLRAMLTVSALVLAWRVLVIVGVFDNWVNFRKFLIDKSEGDQ